MTIRNSIGILILIIWTGAIVNSGAETADAKKEALKSAGVQVAETITKIGEAMKISMGVS